MNQGVVISGTEKLSTIRESMKRWREQTLMNKVEVWTKEQFLEDMTPHVSPNRLEHLRSAIPDGVHLWPSGYDITTPDLCPATDESTVEFRVTFKFSHP